MTEDQLHLQERQIDLGKITRYDWLLSTCDMSGIGLFAFETMCESGYLEWVLESTDNLKAAIFGAFMAWAENVYTLEGPDMTRETADYVATYREAEAQLDAMSELQAARLIEAIRGAVLDNSKNWPEHYKKLQA